MQHIPFPGAGPATKAVLAGQVDLYTANIGSLHGPDRRRQGAPDRGDLEEALAAICPTFRRSTSSASRTPSPTPSRASTRRPARRSRSIDRLAKELNAILARPDVREKFVKAGLPVVAEGPEVFRARIAREVPMYKEIIDKAGLKIQ